MEGSRGQMQGSKWQVGQEARGQAGRVRGGDLPPPAASLLLSLAQQGGEEGAANLRLPSSHSIHRKL